MREVQDHLSKKAGDPIFKINKEKALWAWLK
jgi:hypothetical protein